jgi:hypothetical protein
MSNKRKPQQTLGNCFFQKKNSKTVFTGKFVCPICNFFESKDNDMFNLHVDKCLSQQEESFKPIPIYEHNENGNEVLYQEDLKATNIEDDNNVKDLNDINIISIPKDIIIEKHNSIPGLYMVLNFITMEEEEYIVKCIDNDPTPWHHSVRKHLHYRVII